MTNSFFILGVPRSGTTLLAVMLNNHHDIYIPEKSHLGRFLKIFDQLRKDFTSTIKIEPIWNSIKRLRSLKELEPGSENNLNDLINNVLNQKLKSKHAKLWGDKAPPFLDKIPEINLLFPNCKIIHLVRDPRANVYSLIKRQYMTLTLASDLWLKLNNEGNTIHKILGIERILLIRYEDLLSKPEFTLQKICKFLNIEYHIKMINGLTSSKETNMIGAYVKQTIDSSKINSWMDKLNKKQIRRIEAYTQPLLSYYRYLPQTKVEGMKLKGLNYIWAGILQNFQDIFRSRKEVMMGRHIETVEIPLKKRVRKFVSNVSDLFFSNNIKDLFK